MRWTLLPHMYVVTRMVTWSKGYTARVAEGYVLGWQGWGRHSVTGRVTASVVHPCSSGRALQGGGCHCSQAVVSWWATPGCRGMARGVGSHQVGLVT